MLEDEIRMLRKKAKSFEHITQPDDSDSDFENPPYHGPIIESEESLKPAACANPIIEIVEEFIIENYGDKVDAEQRHSLAEQINCHFNNITNNQFLSEEQGIAQMEAIVRSISAAMPGINIDELFYRLSGQHDQPSKEYTVEQLVRSVMEDTIDSVLGVSPQVFLSHSMKNLYGTIDMEDVAQADTIQQVADAIRASLVTQPASPDEINKDAVVDDVLTHASSIKIDLKEEMVRDVINQIIDKLGD